MKTLARFALLNAIVSAAGTASAAAVNQPVYVALGMSSAALTIALATAIYVYAKVTRAGRQEARVTAVEAAASELDRAIE